MRVPTGPGKVRDSRNQPGSIPNELFGHLFNFDIDDATVKIEHLLWLDTFVLPFLLGCREVTVALKGLASRSGSKAYNDQLSSRRVEAVKKVLLERGVQPNQITTNFVGEMQAAAQGRRDGSEEAEDRAVDVLVKRPMTLPARFDRVNALDIEDGFDHERTPPFLMVPAPAGERTLLLLNAAGLLLRTSDFGVLQPVHPLTGRSQSAFVVPSNRVQISFRAAMEGEATIELENLNGSSDTALELAILPPRTVTVSFHYVQDNAHKTARGRNSEDPMLVVANRVFNRQANVFFVKGQSRPLRVNDNWNDPIMASDLGGADLPKLRSLGDANARLNVFFVWEYQRSGTTNDTDARVDKISGNNVLFEDNAGTDTGLSMAHEFGHNLGLRHSTVSNQLLLWPVTDDRGGRLRKDEILLVNSSV